jgi:hypothetical protein
MSLVQTLRQYVLCYESVLHEVVEVISSGNRDNEDKEEEEEEAMNIG